MRGTVKNKRELSFSAIVVIAVIAIELAFAAYHLAAMRKPFEHLSADNVAEIRLSALSTDPTLTKEQARELLDILKDVRVYGEAPIHLTYFGGERDFTIVEADGTEYGVMFIEGVLGNGYYIKDGRYYPFSRTTCDRIIKYRHELERQHLGNTPDGD